MDSTSRKILHFLDSEDIDLKLSSLRVLSELGELKGKNLKVVDKLLDEKTSPIHSKILDVLILRPHRDLLPYYIPFLKQEETTVREKSLYALETLGPIAANQAQKQFKDADYEVKKSFISLLARIPSRSNFEFLVQS